MRIELPFPPSVNSYWRSIIRGKRSVVLISERGREYRVDVQAAILKRFGILRPTQSRLSVSIHAIMPDCRQRDIDNLPKAILDALTHARVWVDDSQIDVLMIRRGAVCPPGGLVIEITRLAAEPVAEVQTELFKVRVGIA